MKIAVISNSAGSLLNFRGPLLVEMIARGHEVLALAPDHDGPSRAALRNMGAQPVDFAMVRTGTNPVQEIGTIVDLCRILRQHRPDVSFSYVIKPVIYGTLASWLTGVKRRYGMIEGLGFAFTEGGDDNRRRRAVQKAIALLARVALARVDRLVFLNLDDLDLFVTQGLVQTQRTSLLGGIGVDLADWAPAPLPGGPITFVLAARLLRDKGIADYVAAARLLRASHPDARFLLLGGLDSNPAGITRAEVDAWVQEGLIEWPGHVDVKPWLAAAHVFVLPSYREGVPRSTQEAMALGRPIVTTDAPGCRETVVDGMNGYLVPVRDPEALAAAMRRFIVDPSIIEPMGGASRQLAEERFDVHVQNRKLLAFMNL